VTKPVILSPKLEKEWIDKIDALYAKALKYRKLASEERAAYRVYMAQKLGYGWSGVVDSDKTGCDP
jgi:hypothetical protein